MLEKVFEKLLLQAHKRGVEAHGDNWMSIVGQRLEYLRKAYKQLTADGRDPIDYADDATQAAYLFAYAIGRAEFTYQLLKCHRQNLGHPLFSDDVIRITSIGGGPGSEIAGIVKYILDPKNGENVSSITYWTFDKDDDWEPVCKKLVKEISGYITITHEYHALDLTDKNACSKLSLKGDHLLVLSFVISEVCAVPQAQSVLESLRSIYKTIDHNGMIFYNDSDASDFYYFFNESRKFVTGLGKASQKSEVKADIQAVLNFEKTYCEFIDRFKSTPHLASDALSKLLSRQLP